MLGAGCKYSIGISILPQSLGANGCRVVRVAASFWTGLALGSALAGASAWAGVSSPEAQALKSTLTPVGAEPAANAAGTIPAWTGGYTTVPSGYREGNSRPDPFAAEKPLFSITARNFRSYAENLPEGTKHLFEKYPDYRMDIYPSHRTATVPDWVADNIYRNATTAHAAPEGIAYGVEGAVGGIPFPIPKNGFEAMWNHLLAFWGTAREARIGTLRRVGGWHGRRNDVLQRSGGLSVLL